MLNKISKISNLLKDIIYEHTNESNIYLSIDFLNLIISLGLRKKEEINAALLDIENTLKLDLHFDFDLILIPSFSFNFPQKKIFNTLHTNPELGALSNYFFKKKLDNRSMHPFYSFYVFGKKTKEFISNECFDSVGEKSIFKYLKEEKFFSINIGHHYCKSIPNIHDIENKLKVKYRSVKYFQGILVDPFQNKFIDSSFAFNCRNEKICSFSGITSLGIQKIELNKISNKSIYETDYSKLGVYFLDIDNFTNYIINNHSESNQLVDYYHPDFKKDSHTVSNQNAIEIYKSFLLSV